MSEPGSPSSPPFPGPRAALEAFRFAFASGSSAMGAWAVYLPVAGLTLGALSVATDAAVASLAGRRWLSSLAVVVVYLVATRGGSVQALAALLSAWFAPCGQALARLQAPQRPAVRIVALGVVLLRLALLLALRRFRIVGLAFAPLLGACSMVVLAVGSRAARADGRRLKFAPAVQFREFGIASAATFALIFLTTEFLGLLLILATAAFTVAARVASHRWLDGVNETVLLASSEATQLVVLAVLVAF